MARRSVIRGCHALRGDLGSTTCQTTAKSRPPSAKSKRTQESRTGTNGTFAFHVDYFVFVNRIPAPAQFMASTITISSDEPIVCPKDQHRFPLHQGITRQTIEKYERKFDKELEKRGQEFREQIEKDVKRKAAGDFASKQIELEERLAEKDVLLKRAQMTRETEPLPAVEAREAFEKTGREILWARAHPAPDQFHRKKSAALDLRPRELEWPVVARAIDIHKLVAGALAGRDFADEFHLALHAKLLGKLAHGGGVVIVAGVHVPRGARVPFQRMHILPTRALLQKQVARAVEYEYMDGAVR
jgi:hypothetical protein